MNSSLTADNPATFLAYIRKPIAAISWRAMEVNNVNLLRFMCKIDPWIIACTKPGGAGVNDYCQESLINYIERTKPAMYQTLLHCWQEYPWFAKLREDVFCDYNDFDFGDMSELLELCGSTSTFLRAFGEKVSWHAWAAYHCNCMNILIKILQVNPTVILKSTCGDKTLIETILHDQNNELFQNIISTYHMTHEMFECSIRCGNIIAFNAGLELLQFTIAQLYTYIALAINCDNEYILAQIIARTVLENPQSETIFAIKQICSMTTRNMPNEGKILTFVENVVRDACNACDYNDE